MSAPVDRAPTRTAYSLVVPTTGRPSLARLLDALARAEGPRPHEVVLVDDRPAPETPLDLGTAGAGLVTHCLASGGRGPAAARNVGWRATTSPWVAFLDDDVVPEPDWFARLADDLAAADDAPAALRVAGTQGRVHVPLPAHRRPTDWERNVAGLDGAFAITADLAYRRDVLGALGGFDERFPRAYREDADLALRVRRDGATILRGTRRVDHPVGPAPWWVSVAKQAGNADDRLMTALHGPTWRAELGAPPGRLAWHLATTGAAALAVAGTGRARALGLLAWAALTADFARRRIGPGPRTAREIAAMTATSIAIPPAATWWSGRGALRARRLVHQRPAHDPVVPRQTREVRAVLFDRDGTLVRDVPYNGDPRRVEPMPGAADVVRRLRDLGVAVGLVSNQSGIARGLLTPAQVDAVNRRVSELVGPLDPVLVCPHGPDDGCGCRKPAPGLVQAAAARLGVDPAACVVVGDIGADVGAARAAGARSILVPTDVTRPEEIDDADVVALDLEHALDTIVAWHGAGSLADRASR